MRFIHMADVHFDSPFTVLASRENLANERRLEQRKAFADTIEYIKENQIPFLFISGDLYEQKYIRKSTIEYINNLFKEIPNTQIFISPGNHDPFLINSFYNTFEWNNNVTIFNSEIKIIETEEADIYGFGFTDFYCENSQIEKINIKNKNKINILITHGSLDASKTLDMQYNPLNSNKLKEIGFDYVALGHIHKANYEENKNNFIYPGSLISFGFDELGEHGFLDVEINKNNSEKNNLINLKINNNNLNIFKSDLNKINSSSFSNKMYTYFGACRTGNKFNNTMSFAQSWANMTGGLVQAATGSNNNNGRTDYQYIYSYGKKEYWGIFNSVIDLINGIRSERSDERADYGWSTSGSLNYPVVNDGGKFQEFYPNFY